MESEKFQEGTDNEEKKRGIMIINMRKKLKEKIEECCGL
jgi:hypothetical protein